jgi:2'-5' RNA ligase
MKRVRTFIAIDPGKTIRERLVALQERLQNEDVKAKWVEPENLHLTLLFLGEVEYTTVPDVCKAVQEALHEHASFPMTIAATGCFPNTRRPRILWAGVTTGVQEVVAVHDALEPPLLDLGCYRREERKYTPHLTIGRIQGDRGEPKLAPALGKLIAWKGGDTMVDEVLVMSSELMPKGPIYTVLSRAKLS